MLVAADENPLTLKAMDTTGQIDISFTEPFAQLSAMADGDIGDFQALLRAGMATHPSYPPFPFPSTPQPLLPVTLPAALAGVSARQASYGSHAQGNAFSASRSAAGNTQIVHVDPNAQTVILQYAGVSHPVVTYANPPPVQSFLNGSTSGVALSRADHMQRDSIAPASLSVPAVKQDHDMSASRATKELRARAHSQNSDAEESHASVSSPRDGFAAASTAGPPSGAGVGEFEEEDVDLECMWISPNRCGMIFGNPEELYRHLTEDHIGRKTKGNLCLNCFWSGCSHMGETFGKRDHVTSHLRIHVPLKPHVCELCRKAFKRPQDLRKHKLSHSDQRFASPNSASPDRRGSVGHSSGPSRHGSSHRAKHDSDETQGANVKKVDSRNGASLRRHSKVRGRTADDSDDRSGSAGSPEKIAFESPEDDVGQGQGRSRQDSSGLRMQPYPPRSRGSSRPNARADLQGQGVSQPPEVKPEPTLADGGYSSLADWGEDVADPNILGAMAGHDEAMYAFTTQPDFSDYLGSPNGLVQPHFVFGSVDASNFGLPYSVQVESYAPHIQPALMHVIPAMSAPTTSRHDEGAGFANDVARPVGVPARMASLPLPQPHVLEVHSLQPDKKNVVHQPSSDISRRQWSGSVHDMLTVDGTRPSDKSPAPSEARSGGKGCRDENLDVSRRVGVKATGGSHHKVDMFRNETRTKVAVGEGTRSEEKPVSTMDRMIGWGKRAISGLKPSGVQGMRKSTVENGKTMPEEGTSSGAAGGLAMLATVAAQMEETGRQVQESVSPVHPPLDGLIMSVDRLSLEAKEDRGAASPGVVDSGNTRSTPSRRVMDVANIIDDPEDQVLVELGGEAVDWRGIC